MKKHRLTLAFLALALLMVGTAKLYADVSSAGVLFLRIAPGARAAGMGEAFVAVADDASATHWNPAGLGAYPMADNWLDQTIPSQYRPLTGIAPLRIEDGGDFRSYDVWAISSNSLIRYNGKDWSFEEVFQTRTDETVLSKIHDYLEFADDALLKSVIAKVAAANSDKSYEEVAALRQMVVTNATESYSDLGTLKSNLDSLVASYELCLIQWDRFSDLSDAVNKGFEDSTFSNEELEKINFAAQNTLGRFIPEDLKIPYSAILTSAPTAISSRGRMLLVGTSDGLWQYNGISWTYFGVEKGLPSANTTSIARVGSFFVIGTDNGVAMLEATTITVLDSTGSLPAGVVEAVGGDKLDNLFAIVNSDFYRFDGTRWSNSFNYTTGIDDSQSSIADRFAGAQDSASSEAYIQKLILMNQTGGAADGSGNSSVSFVSGSKVRLPYIGSFEGMATSLLVDPSGDVWVGTEAGVYRFNGTRWKRPTQVPPASGKILDIQIHENTIYVATEQGLLTYESQIWSRADIRGLGDKPMSGLGSVDGLIWFVSNERLVVRGDGKSQLTGMHVNWLPELADDIYYEFLSFTKPTENLGTFGGNITFITYGTLNRTSSSNIDLGSFTPSEMAFTLSYGNRLTQKMFGGVSAKIIYSGLSEQGTEKELGDGTAWAYALDFGILFKPSQRFTLGAQLANLGPNITYVDAAQSDPLPLTLAVGVSYKLLRSEYTRLLATIQMDKPLDQGFNNNASTELKELIWKVGAEFWYSDLFAVRGGYIYDQEGQVKVPTIGVGVRPLDAMQFDFAYIPDDKNAVALANTLRMSFTLHL